MSIIMADWTQETVLKGMKKENKKKKILGDAQLGSKK